VANKHKNRLLNKLGIGKTRLNVESKPTVRAPQKLVFMHIAKAAGSTINTFFAEHYSPDRYAIHIESNPTWQSSPEELKDLDFLSGHISLHILEKKLALEGYYKVTVIREPYAQLSSHLAWIKRLSMPGEEQRFRAHPAYIQKFASKLAAIDFANPADLKALTASLTELEARLIDNCQVRYFTHVPPNQAVSGIDTQKATQASATFDRVGLMEFIDRFMKDVAGDMSWPKPRAYSRENITQNFYGLDLSDNKTREVLWPLVQHDIAFYEYVANLQMS
jgi:hypothetical protein